MRILSGSSITEFIPDTARRDVLLHLQRTLVCALPIPELQSLIASYDEVLEAKQITALAVALLASDNDRNDLTDQHQHDLRQFGHNVRSLDMRAMRFSRIDTSTQENGDIGSCHN